MSDAEYSTSYEVYLTRFRGVQIVTNDLSLSILKNMRFHEVSPSDIAVELGLPKSTIQANITKLMRSGIVKQIQSKEDARRVGYHLDAILMFCSDADFEWQLYARLASDIRIIQNGRCTYREDLSLYAASLTESGLNIVQGLFGVGAALTSGMNDSDFWNDLLTNGVKDQAKKSMLSVNVDTDNGLEVDISSTCSNISDIPLILVPMLGAVISHSRQALGYSLAHDISLFVTNEGFRVNLLVEPFIGEEYNDEIYDVRLQTMESFRVERPFSIYSIDRVATMFTNPTMMGILDVLCNGPASVNTMADTMNTSKATIYAVLTKLIEMGAVEVDGNSGTPKCYKLLADPILYCTEPTSRNCQKLNDIVRGFQAGEIEYYPAVISLAMEAIGLMGIHFDGMFVRSGRATARTILELMPDITPEKLLEIGCQMVSIPDKAEIISILPIKIRITLSPDTLWESWPADFVKGFVSEGLKILLDEDYKINIESVKMPIDNDES